MSYTHLLQTNFRWEVGSEFAWLDPSITLTAGSTEADISTKLNHAAPELWSDKPYELFATGRAALLSLFQLLQSEPRYRQEQPKLYLPSFFCSDVAAKLNTICEIAWYRDLPTKPSPDFRTLNPAPGDFVLAVNFFWNSSSIGLARLGCTAS